MIRSVTKFKSLGNINVNMNKANKINNWSIETIKKRNLFTIVDQATVKYRETLGMSRTRLGPGVSLYIPMIHKIQKIDLRVQTQNLRLECYSNENIPVVVGGSLFFRVSDAEKVCYSVKDYFELVSATGNSAIRAIIGRFTYDRITRERSEINVELQKEVGCKLLQYGIECTSFEIQEFKPQRPEVAKQLELQMEAERKCRENELHTQARIRTAAGERDSAILASEGKLQADKNRAEADYVLVQRKADAKKYEIDLMTSAQVKQIQDLAKELGSVDKASTYLLQLNSLKNLGKIAESPNNSTYFMPNDYTPFKAIGDLLKK